MRVRHRKQKDGGEKPSRQCLPPTVTSLRGAKAMIGPPRSPLGGLATR
jgi:hypothetical protein